MNDGSVGTTDMVHVIQKVSLRGDEHDMKAFKSLMVLVCCLALVAIGCGEDENGDNGDNGNNDTGGFTLQSCVNTCEEASDCGEEEEWACNDGICEWEDDDEGEVEEFDPCESDAECVAQRSGWQDTCDEQADCGETHACVEFEGQGYCALEETEFVVCDDMGFEALDLPLADDGEEEATVCGNTNTECHSEGFCTMCSTDADCEEFGLEGWDTCYDGICGCADDNSCGEDQACESLTIDF